MLEGSMFDALELENCELISSVLLSYHNWLELRLSRVWTLGSLFALRSRVFCLQFVGGGLVSLPRSAFCQFCVA